MAIKSSIDGAINFDRQLSNLWTFNILTKNSISASGGTNSNSDTNRNYENSLFGVLVKGVDLPFVSLDISSTYFGKKFYGKTTQENTLSLEVFETDKIDTFKYFNDWFNTIYNVEECYFYSFDSQQDYEEKAERTCTLTFERPDSEKTTLQTDDGKNYTSYKNSFKKTVTYTMNNVKLNKIGNITIDYEKGDPISFKIDLVFDSVTVKIE